MLTEDTRRGCSIIHLGFVGKCVPDYRRELPLCRGQLIRIPNDRGQAIRVEVRLLCLPSLFLGYCAESLAKSNEVATVCR